MNLIGALKQTNSYDDGFCHQEMSSPSFSNSGQDLLAFGQV